MFDAYLAPIHGGSMIAFAGHRGRRPAAPALQRLLQAEEETGANEMDTYARFARQIGRIKQRDLDYLTGLRRQGQRVYGMGAPVKGNTLLNYFGVDTRYLRYLVEKNRLRRGLYSPGMHIPVVLEDELTEPPDVYYVLAWNFRDEILARNRSLLDRGVQFYFPVHPRLRAA
jgi:hypothetical protein